MSHLTTSRSNDLPDLSGQCIDNSRLQLVTLLSEGAYGKVYKAVDNGAAKDSQAVYAVKCVKKDPHSGSCSAKFITKELAIHDLLNGHPNIIKIHCTISDPQFIYLVLDLAHGDLFDAIVVKKLYKGKEELARNVFLQVVAAVVHCHELGVAHCDIKPENILCDESGEHIMLADFGLATTTRLDDTGRGSYFYMSPECIGREYRAGLYSTNSCDIWALGILLINFLTLHNPWNIASSSDECFSAYISNPDWLYKVLPVSSEVNGILKRILDLNPMCRIPLWKLRQEIREVNTFFKPARPIPKPRRSSFAVIRHSPRIIASRVFGRSKLHRAEDLVEREAKITESQSESSVSSGSGSSRAQASGILATACIANLGSPHVYEIHAKYGFNPFPADLFD